MLKIKISQSTKYCTIISRGDSYLPMSQYSDGNYSSSESITALFLPVTKLAYGRTEEEDDDDDD